MSESDQTSPCLTAEQWQRLLVSAIYLLQNSANPEADLAYSKWLVEQWQIDQQRILNQKNEQQPEEQALSL